MRPRGRWPGSFLKLLWIGFVCVSIPLGAAVWNAGRFVERLADDSGAALDRATRAASDSRRLADLVVSMERKARQLHVLGDPSLLEDYRERRSALRDTVRDLYQLPFDPEHRQTLSGLVEEETRIYRALTDGPPPRADAMGRALDRFSELHALASRIVAAADRIARAEAEATRTAAVRTRRWMLGQALALVPVTFLLTALFTRLLARPVRQIDQAIRRLGEGRFDPPIRVGGPRDLVVLGERLDWLRQRLVELEGEKAKFLAHVSHELKTPLTAIREGADLLLEGVAGRLGPGQAEVAKIVRDNTVELQGLIENLLQYSMGRARRDGHAARSVALHRIARHVIADHRAAVLAKGIQLEEHLEEIEIRGDPARLRAVVDNLLSNAVKFTPDGGTVRVAVDPAAGGARIVVADSGPGIPPEERQRVFEPFYQGRRPSRGAVRGSGLGLSIVAEYVRDHGGTVSVEEADGGGARFTVTLPPDREGAP